MARYKTLEIGCGAVNDIRFDLRNDIQPHPHVNYVADMRKLEGIPDHSIALIKSAASLEHISPDDQVVALKEWHRVLIPHGVVLIMTPDLDWIESIKDIDPEWYIAQKNGGMIDQYDYHRGLLNAAMITILFSKTGFRVLQLHDGKEAAGSLDVFAESI